MKQIDMISVLDGYISATVTIYGTSTNVKLKDDPTMTNAERDDKILELASMKTIYKAMTNE